MEKEVIIAVAGIAAVLLYFHYHNKPATVQVAAATPSTQQSNAVVGAVASGAVDIIDSISSSISDALN